MHILMSCFFLTNSPKLSGIRFTVLYILTKSANVWYFCLVNEGQTCCIVIESMSNSPFEFKPETRLGQNGFKTRGKTVSGPTGLMTGLESNNSCCFFVQHVLGCLLGIILCVLNVWELLDSRGLEESFTILCEHSHTHSCALTHAIWPHTANRGRKSGWGCKSC